ncbi:hypothetical protein [Microbulbifer sp. MCCC 1A16149]|uniref:hypothetical protein n=1 Tax=Microbulbifer sp. MCCC 1A16149 TaxID=3411322 RepID=UPI003D0DEC19
MNEPTQPFLPGSEPSQEELFEAMRLGIESRGKYRGLQNQYRQASDMAAARLGSVRGQGLSATAPTLANAIATIYQNYRGGQKMSELEKRFEQLSKQEAEGDMAKLRLELAAGKGDKWLSGGDGVIFEQGSGESKRLYDAEPKQTPEENLEGQKELKRYEADLKKQAEAEKRAAEEENDQLELAKTYNAYRTGMETLEATLGDVFTGPMWGMLPATTEDQQIADGAINNMSQVLKSLFRTSGEGTFTDKDQEILMSMIPTRKDSPGAAQQKIMNLNRLVEAKLGIRSTDSNKGVVDRSTPDEFEARASKYGL